MTAYERLERQRAREAEEDRLEFLAVNQEEEEENGNIQRKMGHSTQECTPE